MNELYVTGPGAELTSDNVFYMPHVDGPWMLFPGAAVHRAMVGVSPNRRVRTHFPMSSEHDAFLIGEGDAVSFDFNRELHFITRDASDDDTPRINLKLHYVAYARGLGGWAQLLARLTTAYDVRARELFVATLRPTTLRARLGARYVIASTKLAHALVAWVGPANLAYALALAAASIVIGSPLPWIAGISFVHYLCYLAVLRKPEGVAFPTFVRDAIFFKTLSLGTLACCYLAVFRADALSLGLAAGGFGLAALASRALGLRRTFFGAELGVVEARRVTTFPYGVVPHPMILGSMIGLLGLHALPEMRASHPFLVPIHVALYALVLAQEIVVTRTATAPESADAPSSLRTRRV
jgi:hypothetical protein